MGGLFVLAVFGLFFYLKSRKVDHKRRLWFYLLANIILAAIVINTLFVINIEMVHFPQYALFAILVFPLIGNYTATLIWSTLAGAVDEAYQYFYLAPTDTTYFDFNDVVTNLVGAVFGLLFLSGMNVKEYTTFQIKKSSIWFGIGSIVLTVLVLHLLGYLSIYPNDDRPFHILREWPSGFWSKARFDVTFHIIRPLEGVVLTILLWVFFSRLSPSKNAQ